MDTIKRIYIILYKKNEMLMLTLSNANQLTQFRK